MRASPSRWTRALIERLAREHEVLITIEEGAIGGFGALVLHHLASAGCSMAALKIRTMCLPDRFIDHDTPKKQYDEAGLNAPQIVADRAGRAGPVGQGAAGARLTRRGAAAVPRGFAAGWFPVGHPIVTLGRARLGSGQTMGPHRLADRSPAPG